MVEKARLEREEMLKRETPAQRKKREKKEEREELEEEERAQRIHEEVRSRALFYHRNDLDATPLVSYLVPLWLFHFGYSTLVVPLWFHTLVPHFGATLVHIFFLLFMFRYTHSFLTCCCCWPQIMKEHEEQLSGEGGEAKEETVSDDFDFRAAENKAKGTLLSTLDV